MDPYSSPYVTHSTSFLFFTIPKTKGQTQQLGKFYVEAGAVLMKDLMPAVGQAGIASNVTARCCRWGHAPIQAL